MMSLLLTCCNVRALPTDCAGTTGEREPRFVDEPGRPGEGQSGALEEAEQTLPRSGTGVSTISLLLDTNFSPSIHDVSTL